MTLKRILIALYIVPLVIFFATTIFAAFADILGSCAYDEGTITDCRVWGRDYSWIFARTHIIGFMSNWSFLVTWILMGGCTMYVMDWLRKRNA